MDTKGARTRRLHPEINPWVIRTHGEINYFITEGFSGYGCFGIYLKRISEQDIENCWYSQERDLNTRCSNAKDDLKISTRQRQISKQKF
ncbi:hypothetical protein Zmor_002221 [Zophobas morio]|uniref:Uncharacterized protein n=1 Tax=Zophobas morio TaxID=2755281 RepID=A0AA38J422_9CUCU|nr:hypothetical protein Zmor_002221 [Zophobas morio]